MSINDLLFPNPNDFERTRDFVYATDENSPVPDIRTYRGFAILAAGSELTPSERCPAEWTREILVGLCINHRDTATKVIMAHGAVTAKQGAERIWDALELRAQVFKAENPTTGGYDRLRTFDGRDNYALPRLPPGVVAAFMREGYLQPEPLRTGIRR